jgi:glycosyltransferase involved in cell wall biosynthesis
MNIAIITDTSLWGGLETHAAALAHTLDRAGYRVTIFCLDARALPLFRKAVPETVGVAELHKPPRNGFFVWLRALQEVDADAVLLEKGTLNTGSAALDFALRLKFGRYVTYQQLEPPKLPARTSKRYLGGLIPGVGLWWYKWRFSGWLRSLAPRATICVSDSARDALATDYGFSMRKLVTIRHGIDLEQFRPDTAMRARARASWGVPDDAFVFGTVRRFVYEKGIDVLVEAFAALRKSATRDIRLVLIGEGPEQSALQALAENHGVGDAVVFPGFTMTPWTAYPGLDVFVIPSRIEALGVVVVEAMASGCFVIASRVGGIPEMISDPSLGILVPAGDSFALAGALQHTLSIGRDQMAEHVEHARLHVAEHFNLQVQCTRIADLMKRNVVSV